MTYIHPVHGELVGYEPLSKRYAFAKPELDEYGELVDRITVIVDESETLAMNHLERMATAGNKHEEWSKIASIPMSMLYSMDLNRANNEGDDAYLKRWLNDSDNRAWRTKEGRV